MGRRSWARGREKEQKGLCSLIHTLPSFTQSETQDSLILFLCCQCGSMKSSGKELSPPPLELILINAKLLQMLLITLSSSGTGLWGEAKGSDPIDDPWGCQHSTTLWNFCFSVLLFSRAKEMPPNNTEKSAEVAKLITQNIQEMTELRLHYDSL